MGYKTYTNKGLGIKGKIPAIKEVAEIKYPAVGELNIYLLKRWSLWDIEKLLSRLKTEQESSLSEYNALIRIKENKTRHIKAITGRIKAIEKAFGKKIKERNDKYGY